MTPSELKYHIKQSNPDTHFFDRKTMQFFGDSMKNFGCRKVEVVTDFQNGQYIEGGITVEAFELYRKHPAKHGLKSSYYFDCSTFKQIRPKGN